MRAVPLLLLGLTAGTRAGGDEAGRHGLRFSGGILGHPAGTIERRQPSSAPAPPPPWPEIHYGGHCRLSANRALTACEDEQVELCRGSETVEEMLQCLEARADDASLECAEALRALSECNWGPQMLVPMQIASYLLLSTAMLVPAPPVGTRFLLPRTPLPPIGAALLCVALLLPVLVPSGATRPGRARGGAGERAGLGERRV